MRFLGIVSLLKIRFVGEYTGEYTVLRKRIYYAEKAEFKQVLLVSIKKIGGNHAFFRGN